MKITGYKNINIIKDIQNIERVVIGQKIEKEVQEDNR